MKEHNFKVGDKVRVVEKATHGDIEVGVEGVLTEARPFGDVRLGRSGAGFFYGDDGGKLELVKDEYPNPPHKHRDLIIEWAKGADIEFNSLARNGKWVACQHTPVWEVTTNYRITAPKVLKSPKDLEVYRIEEEMRIISEKQLKLAEDLANLK